jgi:hypothetical protein
MRHKKHIQINALLFIIVFSLFSIPGKSERNRENNAFDSTLTELKTLEIPTILIDSIINFNITSEIYYTKVYQFRTKKGKKYFVEGWENTEVLKKFIFETDSLRNEYSKSNVAENKTTISNRVIELENRIIETKSISDFNYLKASEYEFEFWNRAPDSEIRKLIIENDSIKSLAEKKLFIEITNEISTDTFKIDLNKTDSLRVDSTKFQAEISAVDPPKTGIIIFKVQIGAYNTELPESAKKLYKKISLLRKIDQFIDDRKYTIYTIGELTNIKDAVKLQEQIRQESVKDAFVIAYKDGKRISLNEALELTK